MRKVEHGVTVEGPRRTRKPRHLQMAEKLQNNDATLRFLDALNFDADEGSEPGVEVVDTAIEKAVIFDDEEDNAPVPGGAKCGSRRDRTRRRRIRPRHAMDRTRGKAKPARSREPVQDLETASRPAMSEI